MLHNPLIRKPSRPLPRHVAIVGAGTIGPDIGYYLKSALPELTLTLVDVVPEALERARGRIEGYVSKGLAKKKLSEAQAEAVRKNLNTTLEYGDIAGADWVLEAATENLELKRKIFRQIESLVAKDAIITSNTSSLPASRLFSELEHKGRATVTHFFAPAYQNPAVEVVRWEHGSKEVLDYLRWVFAFTGKIPFVTEDALCFMLDRVFDNWCNEAAYLLDRATASEVDSVASDFVHAGPFQVLNLARGNPIIVETNTLQMEEGEHYQPASIFRSVDTWTTVKPGKRVEVADKTASSVRDRLLGVLFSQSVDILDRGIASAEDLNLGCQVALGFKAGPLDLMRERGDQEATRILARFADERPGMPMPRNQIASYQGFQRFIQVDDLDGVKVITLRRPQALNALHDEMTDEILAVIRANEGEPSVKGFVITGYGPKAFCAGADIGRLADVLGREAEAAEYARDCSRLLVHLDRMEKPVVAALNGMALGGGLELALRCRSMVAVKEAFLQLPEVTLGIAPGIGGMVIPYRRWPQAAPMFNEMIRSATRLKAEKALELAVIDRLAGSYEELVAAAVQRVQELAGEARPTLDGIRELGALPDPSYTGPGGMPLSHEVVDLIGKAISEAASAPTLERALEVGYSAFGTTACTKAATEGISSFLGHGKADFTKTG